MQTGKGSSPWSAADFAQIETALWQDDQRAAIDLAWLQLSWQEPRRFLAALHAYSERREKNQSKSIPWSRYDFYYDVLGQQKEQATPALIWFDSGVWRSWSYAELGNRVNSLAATWEETGVQPGDTLAILYPQGPHWLTALLAGLRLGLVITLLPPQGNAFVSRRLDNLAPQWLAMDQLYRHQLAAIWQNNVLPNTLSSLQPTRRPYEYPGTAVAVQCFDPTSPTPDIPCPVDANTLYLGALRDGILALGIRPGETCAAPGWHGLESQPALVLAVLLNGATWVHIDLADLKKAPELLLEQPIDVLGISRSLRDLLLVNPPVGDKPWRYWFRHPAESSNFTVWQDFIQTLQLENIFSGNLLCIAARGGAILFSPRYRGQPHHTVLPAAATCWQLGMVDAPDLPSVGGWGRMALGKMEGEDAAWTATPFILTPYLNVWSYLSQYPLGRAARTYPKSEVLDLLSGQVRYLALVEAFAHGSEADPLHVLLAFGPGVDAAALQALIETELGSEFLPDRIECLPLLPKRNSDGGADQEWCQFHYVTGELYRRQRNKMYCCLSELKQKVLA
ncbi:MAG: AMP-binding protein [Methylobacter sp.]|nr:AMP-binding protein [Methylobacter sp.]MDP2429919.1 AMP-binding protein [Methylobacter sp.]MDP3053182.1 AMP-binding protein [Methylobacter sp.]MDP3360567.1 AMP-binding protein [Methylobacter sp.]MDZ4220989.1 AMP-binding protein [Methylobacter sp.]